MKTFMKASHCHKVRWKVHNTSSLFINHSNSGCIYAWFDFGQNNMHMILRGLVVLYRTHMVTGLYGI